MKRIVAISLLSSAMFVGAMNVEAVNEQCTGIVDASSFSANIEACAPMMMNGEVTEASFKDYVSTLQKFKTAYKDEPQYTILEDKIKEATQVNDVISDIASINPYRVTGFSREVAAARTAYNALTDNAKSYVYNEQLLQTYEAAAAIVTQISAIKLTDTAAEYKRKVEAAKAAFDEAPMEVQNAVGNMDTLKTHENTLYRVDELSTIISSLNKDISTLTDSQISEFVAMLAEAKTLYESLSTTERKLVQGYQLVLDHEKGIGAAMEIVALINEISPSLATFATRTEAAKKKYDALAETDRKFVQNYDKLESYIEPAAISNALKKLKTTSKTFEADVADLRQRFDALTPTQQGYISNSSALTDAEQKLVQVEEMEKLISTIASATAEDMMSVVMAAGEAFELLDAGQRKLVDNANELKKFESIVKEVLKVEALIDKIDIQSKQFTKQATAAQKAYEKLTPEERLYVRNVNALTSTGPISDFLVKLSKLRTSSKTYRQDVEDLRVEYMKFDPATRDLVGEYDAEPKLVEAERMISQANYVDERIARVGEEPEENYVKYVAQTRAAYNELPKDARKLVTKYKELQGVEKQIKPVLKTAELIEALDESPKSLMAAFDKAQKSYAKLKPNQKLLVYNFNILKEYEKPVSVSKKIKALKPTNMYFATDLATARQTYESLTEQQKGLVEGAYRITEAEMEMREVNVIVTLIQNVSITSPNYVKDARSAEQGYKQLMSSYRKLVVNYDYLKDELKSVKKVEKVMKNIDELATLEPKKFATKLKAARKAYDKLEEDEKPHVANYMKLIEYETAESLK